MKEYNLEIRPAYAQLPGTRVLSDGVIFAFVFRSCKECGLILCNLKDEESVRIAFTDEMRFGDLYSCKISGIVPSEWGYRYYMDGISFIDPDTRRLLTLKDGQLAGGIYPASEEHLAPSPEAGHPVDFASQWIYVCNVRAFTSSKTAKVKNKGTFAGVCERIPYLKSLGVKAVEFMPVYELMPEDGLAPVMLKDSAVGSSRTSSAIVSTKIKKDDPKPNLWGFGEGCYFAPRRALSSSDDAQAEFSEMVKKLHEAGILVYLQFNFPDTVSVQTQHEAVKFYATHYQIDGFHIIGSGKAVITLAQDPLLSQTALFHDSFDYNAIKEAPEGAEYYGKPSLLNLCEHNDGYRKSIRSFVKGDPHSLADFLRNFTYVPKGHGRVIYATSFDGFTLSDLVAYNYKHNEENGENNRDGEEQNLSWNCGVEGESRKKDVRALRRRQIRNFLTLLFLSQGTPLIYSGDEGDNSQGGNNNPYCQDNETGWINWNDTKESTSRRDFLTKLIRFRSSYSIFNRTREFSSGTLSGALFPEMSIHGSEAWKADVDGGSLSAGVMYCSADSTLYIGMNMYWDEAELGLPTLPKDMAWKCVINTYEDEPFAKEPVLLKDQQHLVMQARSVCVLEACKA